MHKGRKVAFDDFIVVSRKQVELAILIRQYRRIHQLSQMDMAKICTLHGEPYGVKILQCEICAYENYERVPTTPKFQILMKTMDVDPSIL